MTRNLIACPPTPPPLFNATSKSLVADVKRIIDHARCVQDDIVANITPEAATFANTLLPLAEEENHMLYDRQLIEFYSSMTTDENIQEASLEAEELFSKFDTETSLRDDLYSLVAAARDRGEVLNAEPQRFLTVFLERFEQNGLSLSEDGRARLRDINAELERIKNEYVKIASQDFHLWLTPEDLEGVDNISLDGLKQGSNENRGKLLVVLDGLRLFGFMRSSHNQATRRRVYCECANLCSGGTKLLEEAIKLRQEKAHLLSYPTYNHFRMASEMEKSPEKIQAFLEDLVTQISPKYAALMTRERQMKKDDLKARGEDDDGRFYDWDRVYYGHKLMVKDYEYDSSSVSEYFALTETIPRMLNIFEKVMGLRFQELLQEDCAGLFPDLDHAAMFWYPDVRLFAVWDDTHDNSTPTKFLGYLYMDMYSRKNKRGGFSDLPIRPAFTDVDGTRKYTVTGLVCNFEAPTKSKPCLLEHNNVVLLFHELGHAMHDLVAETKFARFHGASCGDFNEVPSQMLEEWCWEPETLRSLSHHYSNLSPEYKAAWLKEVKSKGAAGEIASPDTLPEHLIENLGLTQQARRVQTCLAMANISLFDMAINAPDSAAAANAINTTQLYHDIACKTFGIDQPADRPPKQATETTWLALDGFYVYLASQVYSRDMYRTVFKPNPMSREEGLRYRRTVIGKGSSEDPMKMLKEFLGRSPTPDALYASFGLEARSTT
ncbi:Hypothetical protein R9X50_00707500 [Acrodontium crateriforme]|uniref:Peptidase M3A/M3B catalytic domain-containing protein n=1 Tax=Acrodontium crateriforme TaxID=150365 RepID=A0AAQ3MDP2_9PEZI|nr:Hypothetical protein R9X50_00707500 [Acrodontium crateriforme]